MPEQCEQDRVPARRAEASCRAHRSKPKGYAGTEHGNGLMPSRGEIGRGSESGRGRQLGMDSSWWWGIAGFLVSTPPGARHSPHSSYNSQKCHPILPSAPWGSTSPRVESRWDRQGSVNLCEDLGSCTGRQHRSVTGPSQHGEVGRSVSSEPEDALSTHRSCWGQGG